MKVLQVERESRGWSRAELARRGKMNPSTVGLIEAGRLVPYKGQLRKLAAALGLPGDQAKHLIEDAGTPISDRAAAR